MSTKYNFVPYKPGKRIYSPNEVALNSKGLYITKLAVNGYVSTENEVFACAHMDKENKVMALKFYGKKDIYGKENLLKLARAKSGGYQMYINNVLKRMGIETFKKPTRIKVKKSPEDLMIIDFNEAKHA